MDNSKQKSNDSQSTTSVAMEKQACLTKDNSWLEYVHFVSKDQKLLADVYIFGGCVTSYVVNNVDYLFIRSDVTMDGSQTISGGLSHCWPQVSR